MKRMFIFVLTLVCLSACVNDTSNISSDLSNTAESENNTDSLSTSTNGSKWVEAGDLIFGVDDYEYSSFSGSPYYWDEHNCIIWQTNGDAHYTVRVYDDVSNSDVDNYLQALSLHGFVQAVGYTDDLSNANVYFNERSLYDSSMGGTEIQIYYDESTARLRTKLSNCGAGSIEYLKTYAEGTRVDDVPEDELLIDSNGKQLWKVFALSNSIHFSASFTGSGHFSITLLNDNQDLEELVCNTIGNYVVDKSVEVSPGEMYYIELSTTDGRYNYSWTGTGGH